MTLDEARHRIRKPDRTLLGQAQDRLDRLTKPPGSLGRLEELAAWYVMLTGEVKPDLPKAAVYTFAADHGIALEGVSAYPHEVTAQMVLNFLGGGAGVNVLAQHVGADVLIVDIGVASELPVLPGLIHRKIARGTKNFLHEPAMTRKQAVRAIEAGIALATEAVREGIGILGTGDMGIGNTTPSAAITAVMTGEPVQVVTGRGTGIDSQKLLHKVAVIEESLARHSPISHDALDVLSKVGGFEDRRHRRAHHRWCGCTYPGRIGWIYLRGGRIDCSRAVSVLSRISDRLASVRRMWAPRCPHTVRAQAIARSGSPAR